MTQMQVLDQSLSSTPNLYTETRAYNARLQLTEIRVTEPMGSVVMQEQYVFLATQNNGQIEQKTDVVSGETVTYAYDALKRLTSAATTGPEWGLSFNTSGITDWLSRDCK